MNFWFIVVGVLAIGAALTFVSLPTGYFKDVRTRTQEKAEREKAAGRSLDS